jgi:hypothetical protein
MAATAQAGELLAKGSEAGHGGGRWFVVSCQLAVGSWQLIIDSFRVWALGFTLKRRNFALHQADLFIVRPDRLKDELN